MDHFPLASDFQRSLEAVADATLVIDNHAHPFWVDSNTSVPTPLVHVLTEAPFPPHLSTPELQSDLPAPPPLARATLAFRRSLSDLNYLLLEGRAGHDPSPNTASPATTDHYPIDDAPTASKPTVTFHDPCQLEQSLQAARANMGIWALAKRCFQAAGVAAVLLDDGLTPPSPTTRPATCHEFEERVGVGVAKRLLRLETEAEHVIRHLMATNISMPSISGEGKRPRMLLRSRAFKSAFWSRLNPLPAGVVGFKSIAAYRGGLGVKLHWTEDDLEQALAKVMSTPGHHKLKETVVIHFVVKWGMEAARLHSIPVQFHCGFGDRDLELPNADPCLLKEVLEAFEDVDVILLHAAWPFVRQGAYLASVYQGVYLDIGLAIPLLSVRGMASVVEQALELAPMTKLMYSSDAHSVPDAFYLAAKWGRRVVAGGVAACVASGDLTLSEGRRAVQMILAENAMRVYGMMSLDV